MACPGCFNPETHDQMNGYWADPRELAAELANHDIDGLTVSGGEPLEQPGAVIDLLEAFRRLHAGTTILLTGFSVARAQHLLGVSQFARLTKNLDALIAGPYRRDLHVATGLRGSSNKEVVRFSGRLDQQDIARTPPAEVIIDAEGLVAITGMTPIEVALR